MQNYEDFVLEGRLHAGCINVWLFFTNIDSTAGYCKTVKRSLIFSKGAKQATVESATTSGS
jgi:hypothetical protein